MVRQGRFAVALLAGLVSLICGGWQAPPVSGEKPAGLPTAAEINGILKELADITGFTVRRELPFSSVTREEVNKYLKDEIKTSVKPDEIQAEEISLKMLGFVPDNFDLKQTTIDLLTEQAAAFYDYHKRKLFISDWAAANMRDEALIHELAHALADQNFSIRKFLEVKSDDGEVSIAREAVMEGQASWLTLEVVARRNGKSLADANVARQLLETNTDGADTEYPVFSKAPLYLRKTLVFPYDAGQKFQQAVFLHDGKAAFGRLFKDPPVSSAQIDYPDRYFAHQAPVLPVLPKLAKGLREFLTGTLGELETGILLEQYVGADFAEDLVPQLKGGQYRIEEDRKTHHRTLLYVSEWTDEASARRFFGAYEDVLKGKSKTLEVTTTSDNDFNGKNQNGYFSVTRNGKQVMAREYYASPFGAEKLAAIVPELRQQANDFEIEPYQRHDQAEGAVPLHIFR